MPIKIYASQIEQAALPLSLIKPYMPLFNKARYAKIFNAHATDRQKCRIYIPITSSNLPKSTTLTVDPAIEQALSSQGYAVSDYKVGLAVGKDGKRQMKIGKLLSRTPDLLKKFVNDPQRSTTKTVPGWVVISRHPYDIVGMSFDRGWTSCMNAADGRYKGSLKEDVKQGTLVAYLIKNNDKNINSPISRVAIRPYRNGVSVAIGAGPIYGANSSAFVSIVDTFCDWANSGSTPGIYTLNKGLYDDGCPSIFVGVGRGLDLSKMSRDQMRNLAGQRNLPIDVITSLSKSKEASLRISVAGNLSAPESILLSLSKDREYMVRVTVAMNTSISLSVLTVLSKDESSDVRKGIAYNRKCPPEVLTALSTDEDVNVRKCVANNSNTPADVLLRMSLVGEPALHLTLIGNPSSPPELIEELSKLDINGIEEAIARSPNTPYDLRLKLSQSKNVDTRYAVAGCVYTPKDILLVLMNDKETTVRVGVAVNPSTTAELLATLSSDPHAHVREFVALHKNTSLEILRALANDEDADVRERVKDNLSYRA